MLRPGPPVRAALLLAALAGGLGSCGGEEPPPVPGGPRVILLGVSGADPDILEAMVAGGELPAFARLLREGARGRLHSLSPLLPPVTWTTVATGKNPGAHGIAEFLAADPETGRLLPVASYLRRVEAVWDILGARGIRVGVVGWPATRPAEPVNGTLVPDRPGPGSAGDLWELFRREARAADAVRREALRIWREESPRFLACHVRMLDPVCRRFMPYAPPRRPDVPAGDFRRYREGVLRAYRRVDALVRDFAEAAGEDATLLVVSAHGMKSGPQRLLRPTVPGYRSEIRWHRPYGLFLAWGRGVAGGARVRGATIHDVTPTVLGLLDLPRAADMPGVFLGEAFRVEAPRETVATYESDRPARTVEMVYGRGASKGWNPLGLAPLDFPGRALTVSDPMVRGALLVQRLQLEKASREYEQAVRRDPGSSRAHFQLGHCYQKMRRPRTAMREYEAAAHLDPDFAAAHIRLALLLDAAGRPEEAIAWARRARRAEPANPVVRCHLGQLLVKAGRVAEGERELRRALALEPNFPVARNQLGILLVSREAFDRAEEQLRAAVDLDPGFVRAWNNLAVAVLRRAAGTRDPRRREEALEGARETLDRIVELFPRYAKAYYNRARLRLLRDERGLALADAERALELDPEYAEARRLVGGLRGP